MPAGTYWPLIDTGDPPPPPPGDEATGLKRPTLPNSCCRNDAEVPGDGVAPATTVTGSAFDWSIFFGPCPISRWRVYPDDLQTEPQ